jgi:hypothetical protein
MEGDAMSRLILPFSDNIPLGIEPGGCLPRITQFGDCCDPMADKIKVIPSDNWSKIIDANPDLGCKQHVEKIFKQRYGSCATESTTQSLAIVRAAAGPEFVLLNALSIYHFTSGGRDRGSNIDSNLKFARDKGICPDSFWPRSQGFQADPPANWETAAENYRIDEFYDIGTADEIGTALLLGLPVVFGWRGHSCVMVKLLKKGKAIYANSWGTSWGNDGFGEIKLSAVNWGYGAFAVRTPNQAWDENGPPVPKAA